MFVPEGKKENFPSENKPAPPTPATASNLSFLSLFDKLFPFSIIKNYLFNLFNVYPQESPAGPAPIIKVSVYMLMFIMFQTRI